MSWYRPPPEPTAIVVGMDGSISRAEIPALCERVRGLLLSSGADAVICDVRLLTCPDVVQVDALACLQLTARRLGRQVALRHASSELLGLLALTGLRDVVPLCRELQARGQPEEREQPGRVEEEGEPRDPVT